MLESDVPPQSDVERAEGVEVEEVETNWVQCDRCTKWRSVDEGVDLTRYCNVSNVVIVISIPLRSLLLHSLLTLAASYFTSHY